MTDAKYDVLGIGNAIFDVLVQTDDEYPILKLNAASWEVMGGKRSVRLIRLTRREKTSASSGPMRSKTLPRSTAPLARARQPCGSGTWKTPVSSHH